MIALVIFVRHSGNAPVWMVVVFQGNQKRHQQLALVTELAYVSVSKAEFCEFESHQEH